MMKTMKATTSTNREMPTSRFGVWCCATTATEAPTSGLPVPTGSPNYLRYVEQRAYETTDCYERRSDEAPPRVPELARTRNVGGDRAAQEEQNNQRREYPGTSERRFQMRLSGLR